MSLSCIVIKKTKVEEKSNRERKRVGISEVEPSLPWHDKFDVEMVGSKAMWLRMIIDGGGVLAVCKRHAD